MQKYFIFNLKEKDADMRKKAAKIIYVSGHIKRIFNLYMYINNVSKHL